MAEEEDRKPLSREEAIALLPDGDDIHTFMAAGFALIGADWSREEVIEAIDKHGAELSGPVATGMNHGINLTGTNIFVGTKSAPGGELSDHRDDGTA
jgi:hypothetical protein